MRRQFPLRQDDEVALAARGLAWETLIEGQARWLILHGYPIPPGYSINGAFAALQLPPSYPDTQIDMVYFNPGLALTTGRAIGALSDQLLDGKTWQRWSRHRTDANPWRPGLDDVATHLLLVDDWLERETRK